MSYMNKALHPDEHQKQGAIVAAMSKDEIVDGLAAQRVPFALFDWMERLALELQDSQYKQLTSSTAFRNSMLQTKAMKAMKATRASRATALLTLTLPMSAFSTSSQRNGAVARRNFVGSIVRKMTMFASSSGLAVV
jgi:hypothetical protein